jgi:hypothetical protein
LRAAALIFENSFRLLYVTSEGIIPKSLLLSLFRLFTLVVQGSFHASKALRGGAWRLLARCLQWFDGRELVTGVCLIFEVKFEFEVDEYASITYFSFCCQT